MANRLVKAIYSKELSSVREYLAFYDINERDRDQRTPLMNAIASIKPIRDHDIIKIFIANGADVNAIDGECLAALHLAVMEDSLDIVRELVGAGAMVEIKDKWGNTPLWRAVMSTGEQRFEIIAFLLRNGANPDTQNCAGQSPKDVAATIEDGKVLSIFERRAETGTGPNDVISQ